MEYLGNDRPSLPAQNYLDYFDTTDPQTVLEEYDNLYMRRNSDNAGFSLLLSAYEEAVIMYAVDSKDEPEAAPRLLSHFAEHGNGNALSLVLMALGNLSIVNPRAAADVYTMCMNRNFVSPEVDEALGIGPNVGIEAISSAGNLTYLNVTRRKRVG